jgi:hypothetical protein
MTKHSVPRRAVIGGGIGLGAGLATGVVQAQAPRRVQAPAPAVTPPAIGFLTSMRYEGSLKDNFLLGLRDNGWEGAGANPTVTIIPKPADGAYDDHNGKLDLGRLLGELNGNSNVKLIVTAGGLAAAFVAQNSSTKPFLVIVGQVPDDFDLNSQYFCGGMNLDTPGGNATRNKFLIDTFSTLANPIAPNQVCLVYNSNSRMTKSERRAWQAHRWPHTFGGVNSNGDNDVTEFGPAFDRAKRNPINGKAVVISADSFFGQNRNELVSAANTSNLYICYPFKYFKNASTPPDNTRSRWYGPDLDDAYKRAGAKAGILLSAIITGSITAPPYPFLELDTASQTSGDFT